MRLADARLAEDRVDGFADGAPRLGARRSHAEWLSVLCLLAVSGFAFFWNLTASGYANEFYSAAAQAGSQSWSAFLWGALDAGGAITVDKPPASIWLMALSVRVLGLSSLAILLPQALMGVMCTYLCYATVRRVWPWQAGIGAGALFVATPVAALMFRFNNPDALLVSVQLGAAYCVLRALEYPADRVGNRRRTLWLACAGALCGLGFLAKQLQVLLVLPGFGLAMLTCSPASWPRRLLDAAVALGTMALAAGWWVVLTVVVPSGARPYIGGSQTDSFLELTFGYNGLGRLTGDETGSVLPGVSGSTAPQAGMWGETGLFRLLGSDFADQFSWWAPLAFAGLVACIVAVRHLSSQVRALPCGPSAACERAGLSSLARLLVAFALVFGCWAVVTWLTFSFMAGIFHAYYTVALAAPLAILAASFVWFAWESRGSWWARPAISVLMCTEALWAFVLIVRSGSYVWLGWAVLVLGLTGASLVAVAMWCAFGVRSNLISIGMALGVAACLVGPFVWTAETVAVGHQGSLPSAGPSSRGAAGGPGGQAGAGGSGARTVGGALGQEGGGPGGQAPDLQGGGPGGQATDSASADGRDEVVALLIENASGYRWAAATTGSQFAASYQLASGLPVMAIGGFNGSDPAPTLDTFKEYVAQGLVRYYIEGGGVGGTQMGGSSASTDIEEWVAEHFEAQEVGGATVYDLASYR